jgi:hypothetical protein
MMMRYRMTRQRSVRFRTVSLFQKKSTCGESFLDAMQLSGEISRLQPVCHNWWFGHLFRLDRVVAGCRLSFRDKPTAASESVADILVGAHIGPSVFLARTLPAWLSPPTEVSSNA